jgi:hypothetical protein
MLAGDQKARSQRHTNSSKSFRRTPYYLGIAGLYLKLILLTLGDS